MKIDNELRDQIFEIIENQIGSDNPPQTKITYDRLVASGYSEFEAKQLIGQCLAIEIFKVIKEQKPFTETTYIKNLNQLPKTPFDE